MIENLNVDHLLAGPLGDWLKVSVADRRKIRLKSWAYMLGGIAAGICLVSAGVFPFASHSIFIRSFLYAFPYVGPYLDFILMFGGAIAGMFLFHRGLKLRSTAIDRMKQEINGTIALALDIRYSAIGKDGPDFDEPLKFKILPDYDFCDREDAWSGEWRDRPFSMVEVEMFEEGYGEDETSRSVFRGLVLHISGLSEAPGIVVVRQHKWLANIFGRSKNWGGAAMQSLKLPKSPFSSEFDVVATDPDAALEMLTPEYQNTLLAMERRSSVNNLNALFVRNELYLTLETVNLFESASLGTGRDRERIERTVEQFRSVASLIDALCVSHSGDTAN